MLTLKASRWLFLNAEFGTQQLKRVNQLPFDFKSATKNKFP